MVGGAVSTEKLILFFKDDTTAHCLYYSQLILPLWPFFMVQLSHPYMTIGKTIALTIWTFFGKVMSLLFNTPSRFVIAFLPSSKRLLISRLQSPSAVIFKPKNNKVSHCFHCLPIYLPWSDGTGSHHLSFINVEFKPVFSLFSFILIKRLFSSSLLSDNFKINLNWVWTQLFELGFCLTLLKSFQTCRHLIFISV